MKNLKLISVLLIAAMSFNAISAAAAVSDISYEQKQLTVHVNEKFNIKLMDTSGSSGYVWDSQYNNKFIKLCSEKIVFPKEKAGYIQCGTKVYIFKALKKGKTKITLVQSRPWSNEMPAKIITYIIKIK
ncbi:protease inhibitor I42 family protein [Methanobacterium alcaliphilum]|uniref:protease inhibitor I42 family protein n=1 Tax=Methanobacterium alcaliphilum TaxID=392018 RepID=UPI00200B572C|nr:protease inhibitor I42 family protein [Methanobacterium alcaliphilum]MCK9151672.1 protease inhibitor I42 family protein [Methanobacterium alcaliphilum]